MVFEKLVVQDNPSLTVDNIQNNDLQFKLGILSFLFIAILDVIIAWAFYYLFKPFSESLSLFSAWLRLVYTLILSVVIVNLVLVSYILNNSVNNILSFSTDYVSSLVMLLLNAFNYGWLLGLSIFGIHLIIMGYMIYKFNISSKLLGILLILAGIAYIIDTIAHIILSNYSNYKNLFLMMVMIFSITSEFWLTIWLLVKGFKN